MRPPQHPIARCLILAAAFLLALSAAHGLQAHPHGPVPTADEVAGKVMTALGGKEAWDATRYIRFTFAGRRTHLWDKHASRNRVEGQTKEGERYVVIQNLLDKTGKVWLNGQPAEGERAQQLLENAYGAWVNDTYWLVMPYKLRDPGVHLAYVGQESLDGADYDKLLLTFERVGLTPGDRYWAYVNRASGLMDRWAYVLQDMEQGAAPTVWLWQGWTKHGRIQLAPDRVQLGPDGKPGERKLPLADIQVSDTFPETAFTSPDPLPPVAASTP
jgi:hypothetical protein